FQPVGTGAAVVPVKAPAGVSGPRNDPGREIELPGLPTYSASADVERLKALEKS
ncbi:MAG: hypothetical protein HOV68_09880, partial [Streptomycetaceae bacterium]|nr:hypothetical protein [Streptomycetaceae bacterium]